MPFPLALGKRPPARWVFLLLWDCVCEYSLPRALESGFVISEK